MNRPATHNSERRSVMAELRMTGVTDGGKKPVIRGHAAVFDSQSDLIGGCFREIIKPGAFAESLKKSDTRALCNHDHNLILGRVSAKTLRMWEDATGLAVEIDIPDTACGRDLQVSMARGDVREMSFAFRAAEDGQEWKRDPSNPDLWIRTITKFERIYDVSPVTYPAYPSTSCTLRSPDKVDEDQARDFKDELSMARLRLALEAAS